MLFIFIAKSGDERNKWVTYLQALTGKLSQTDKQATNIDLRQPAAAVQPSQSSTSSLTSLATTNSSSASSSTANLIAPQTPAGIKTSLSASALSTPSSLQIAPITESGLDLSRSIEEKTRELTGADAAAYVESQFIDFIFYFVCVFVNKIIEFCILFCLRSTQREYTKYYRFVASSAEVVKSANSNRSRWWCKLY